MRALYRAEVVGDPLAGVPAALEAEERLPAEIREYAGSLARRVVDHLGDIDSILEAALLHWELKRLAVIDRCVLRLGVAELLYEHEVPARVVLDEAIEIAKQYGSRESGRFVNGVLDRVARDRHHEGAS
jgi:N utilization substance protein B